MFKLGRERAIACYRRPAIVEDFDVRASNVDHWLNREKHTGFQFWPGAGASGMDHFGRIMEQTADAVPAEIAHHAVAVLLGKTLDRVRDIAEPVARARGINSAHHRFIGHFNQPLGLDRHFTDEISTVGIAVPAINNRGDINIHDITFTQCFVGRNAVAHDMID